MDPLRSIDLYCERTDPAFWSEPVNALTNLGFLLAAWLLWRQPGTDATRGEVRLLAALVGLIGIGSGLFHTFGTVWGSWLDVGFIALFIVTFIHRFVARLVGAGWRWGSLAVIAFLIADRLWARVGSLGLNGSESYLLPWAVLIGFALWSRWRLPAASARLFGAAGLFALSFTLRAIDQRLCDAWPLGTHFGWHLCNAGVLYLCVRGLQAGLDALNARSPDTTAPRNSR